MFDLIYETIPGTGWLSKNEAQLLWEAFKDEPGAILEVGCYHGRSTVLLASLARPVYAVDPFRGFDSDDVSGMKAMQAFQRNLADRRIMNVTLWPIEIKHWTTRKVGCAYLDGDHTYEGTIEQIKVALDCNAKVIAIHDVSDSGDGAKIKQAAIERLGKPSIQVERLAVWHL